MIACGPDASFVNTVYLDTAMSVHLHMIYGYFLALQ